MSTKEAPKWRKVSIDSSLAAAIEQIIEEKPTVAKNLSRFVDDAVRRRLDEI